MPYEIPLEMPGLEKILANFDKVGDKYDSLIQKTKELQQAGGQLGSGSGSQSRGILGGGGGDPWERNSRAIERHITAQMEGFSGDDMKPFELELIRSSKAIQRAEKELNQQPKSQSELVMDAFMTSRFSMGGSGVQFSPLVNRMAGAGLIDKDKMFESFDAVFNSPAAQKMLPLVTKLALPAAIAAAGAIGVYKLASDAAESMRAQGGAYWAGGGTPAQTGQMVALGGFMGLSADQAAERAVQVGDKLRGGGMGASYMRSRGIVDQGPWTINKTENYLKVIDELRSIKSDAKAIQIARDLGLTPELRYRDLSKRTYDRLRDSMGDVGSAEERRNAADFDAHHTILSNYWNKGVRSVGLPLMKGANALASGDAFTNLGSFADLMTAIPGTPQWMMKQGIDQHNRLNGSSEPSAQKELTQAIKDLGRTMKDSAESFGGGRRAKGLPAHLRRETLENVMQFGAIQFGAFNV